MLKISDELDTIVQEGQFEQALESVSRGLETSTVSGKDIGQLQLLGLGGATALSSCDMSLAKEFFSKMVHLQDKMRQIDRVFYSILLAWEALLREDFYQAARHKSQLQSGVELGAPFSDLFRKIAGYSPQ